MPSQVFTVQYNGNLLDGAYFTLERQLVAERLRLDIRHSVFDSSNRSCWILRILGCTFREGMEEYCYGHATATPNSILNNN